MRLDAFASRFFVHKSQPYKNYVTFMRMSDSTSTKALLMRLNYDSSLTHEAIMVTQL